VSLIAFRVLTVVGARPQFIKAAVCRRKFFFHSKPCITLRAESEWVDLQEIGVNKIFSPEKFMEADGITKASTVIESRLRTAPKAIYGDGHASKKIVEAILEKRINNLP
jgi:UDP-GlcNAc3NAcA epimerase